MEKYRINFRLYASFKRYVRTVNTLSNSSKLKSFKQNHSIKHNITVPFLQ